MTKPQSDLLQRMANLPPALQDRMMDIISGAVAMYDPETAASMPAPPKAAKVDGKKGEKA